MRSSSCPENNPPKWEKANPGEGLGRTANMFQAVTLSKIFGVLLPFQLMLGNMFPAIVCVLFTAASHPGPSEPEFVPYTA